MKKKERKDETSSSIDIHGEQLNLAQQEFVILFQVKQLPLNEVASFFKECYESTEEAESTILF
jgi:hypothetical protein